MRQQRDAETIIRDAAQYVEEIKTGQFIAADNLLHYSTFSDDVYDLHVYSNATKLKFEVKLNLDIAREGALIYFRAFYRINNPNVMEDPVPDITAVAPAVDLGTELVVPMGLDNMAYILSIINNQWDLNGTAYDVYVKFFFYGSDTGTWQTTPI